MGPQYMRTLCVFRSNLRINLTYSRKIKFINEKTPPDVTFSHAGSWPLCEVPLEPKSSKAWPRGDLDPQVSSLPGTLDVLGEEESLHFFLAG